MPGMKLSRALDFDFDEGEARAASGVLVPLLLAVVGTTVGVGVAKACCGVSYRKLDPHGVLPIGMALLTSGIAVWSYLNPPPDRAFKR